MFRPYMWAIYRLRTNVSGPAVQECGLLWVFGVAWGEGRGRYLVVPIVGTMTWGYYKWIIISFLCTRVKVYTEN